MPILLDLPLNLDLDEILSAQGTDPAVVRKRNPRLVEAAQRAFDLGRPLLEPVVAYQEYRVKSVQHERLVLANGASLSGKPVVRLLAPARKLVVMVCTLGHALEDFASAVLPEDSLLGLALDGLGTAAVESLAVAACSHFGALAGEQGMLASMPLSPGMDGWPADQGHHQIFALLDPAEAGVSLTSSGMMVPRKSLSLVIGMGEDISQEGRVCDYCSIRQTCRYQERYV